MEKIKDLLDSPGKIVITAHKSPDGDAVGSTMGLYNVLEEMGHEVYAILPDETPEFLMWVKNADKIIIAENDFDKASAIIQSADVVFCLDYNGIKRVGDIGDAILKSGAYKVMIDHHQEPEDFCDLTISDTSSCSTCQMVYEFLVDLNLDNYIYADAGSCLYLGIMTDTGSFRFPSTKAKTHRIIANLIDLGVDNSKIHQLVYDQNRESRLKLIGHALGEKLVVMHDYNTAYMSLAMDDLNRNGYQKGDTEGLVNYGLSIKGIKCSVFFSEKEEGIVKISFRSKGDFSVNDLARKHFSGGGHINAAGGIFEGSTKEAIDKFLEVLPDYKSILTHE